MNRSSDAALSGFQISGNGTITGISLRSITDTTAVVAVPEPVSLVMLGSGLPIALMAWR